MEPVKEVCVESFWGAKIAEQAGANRIELCENLTVGGTTPSMGTIKTCLQKIKVPIVVMIRPRGGNFIYSTDEFEIMQQDILLCKELGVDGIALGILMEDHSIDVIRTSQLIELAKPLKVTFHKAIDLTADILESAKILESIGTDRILTSGGKPTAQEGCDNLNKLLSFAGNRMEIIVAGKVTHSNFNLLRSLIPGRSYHGRNLVPLEV